jgi:hypothetical protein
MVTSTPCSSPLTRTLNWAPRYFIDKISILKNRLRSLIDRLTDRLTRTCREAMCVPRACDLNDGKSCSSLFNATTSFAVHSIGLENRRRVGILSVNPSFFLSSSPTTANSSVLPDRAVILHYEKKKAWACVCVCV